MERLLYSITYLGKKVILQQQAFTSTEDDPGLSSSGGSAYG